MLWQDKLSLLPFLLKDEEKFNKNWHWPSSKTEKVLLVAKSSNCWNKRSSQPQSSARGRVKCVCLVWEKIVLLLQTIRAFFMLSIIPMKN